MPAYTKENIVLGIITQGRRQGVDDLAIVCAISCAIVESNLTMYANRSDPDSLKYPHDAISTDKNSSGIYQQRAPWWDDPTTNDNGGAADRMDVAISTKLFLNQLLKQRNPDYHADPGTAIANTQRPREDLRWKYGARMGEAWDWFNRHKNVTQLPPNLRPPVVAAPQFTEIPMFGRGASSRSRPPINFFLHTEEGDGSAKSLAEYCQGQNGVSYHYTLRGRIVYDVVDTDLYSWSVLDANVFSINLCFAGSRAAMTRAQWLLREDDIEIAAYLAVQDCRKYPTMSTLVIPPPYPVKGAGISDHNYVTRKLGIGNHTDVGPNFPWDVFLNYVRKYDGTGEEDSMTPDQDKLLRELHAVAFNRIPSQSKYKTEGEGARWQLHELVKNDDALIHEMAVERQAMMGNPEALALVKREADKGDKWAKVILDYVQPQQD